MSDGRLVEGGMKKGEEGSEYKGKSRKRLDNQEKKEDDKQTSPPSVSISPAFTLPFRSFPRSICPSIVIS